MNVSVNSFVWSVEHVETLTKMWADGFSASQIACKIGGISRNSVIGKVHRLGLNQRKTAPEPADDFWTKERVDVLSKCVNAGMSVTEASVELGVSRSTVNAKALRMGLRFNGGHRPPAVPRVRLRQERPAKAPIEFKEEAIPLDVAFIPIGQRCSIVELTDAKCHWPIGDPSTLEFFFCGGASLPGRPYCNFHCAIAYLPPRVRTKSKSPQQRRGQHG